MTTRTHGAAVLAALAVSILGPLHAAEPTPVERDDSKAPRPAMTVERNGSTLVSITLYKPDGSKAATIFPDGMINIEPTGGTPEEVARLFWYAVARNMQECAKP